MDILNISEDELKEEMIMDNILNIDEDEFAKIFASILVEKVHEHDELFDKALHVGCASLCKKVKETGRITPEDVMEAFGIDFLLENFEKIASGEIKFSELNVKGEK